MVADDVGVDLAVSGQLTGRGAGVLSKIEIDLAPGAVAKGVGEAGDGRRKEGRIEFILVVRRHVFEFTGVALFGAGNLKGLI